MPVVTTLRMKLADTSSNCEGIKGWKKKLLASLTVRLGWMETEGDYAVATLLDPRFLFNLLVGIYNCSFLI